METEKKALKKEVSLLKKAVRNAEEEIADLNDDLDGFKNDLGAAINQIDDLEQYTRKVNTILKFTAFPSRRKKTFPKKSSSLGKFSTYISPITTSISATEWLHVDLAAIQD